jgi:predicted dehydrogenase
MNDAPLRLGLVGCGRLAELGYAPASRVAGGVEIVAVADPDRKLRGVLATKLGASSHARLGELLGATPLHGLIVCTPPEHHEEIATQAAQAGLSVLVDAPPAADADAALRIAALVPEPWIAFNRRFVQGADLASRVPPGGDLVLKMVLHKRNEPRSPTAPGADALSALAPHLVDLALFLTRSLPLAVRANATRDRAGIVLATTRAEVQIECATDRPHHELVEVRSAGGRLLGRSTSAGRTRGALGRVAPSAHPLVRALVRQLEAYGLALRGRDSGQLATAGEGAAVMRVLEAARRSDAVGGETVAVEGVTVA